METPRQPPSILVVDDDRDILLSLEMLLRHHGYRVFTREKAVDLEADIRAVAPDLIILDVMFAGSARDGFDACRTLRRDPALKKIPLILYTAINEYYPFSFAPDREDLPADALVDKASEPSCLLHQIALLLPGRADPSRPGDGRQGEKP